MTFFRSEKAYLKPTVILQDARDLYPWWQMLRCRQSGFRHYFASTQTHLLDTSFTKLLIDFDDNCQEKKHNAFKKLYAQVLNWQHMHHRLNKNSHRYEQIAYLRTFLEKKLFPAQHTTSNTDPIKQQQAIKYAHYYQTVKKIECLASEQKTINNEQLADSNLYQWWRAQSWLAWFKPRSPATRQLDHAIEWFANHIVLDRLNALQELMNAIDVWLVARDGVSERVPAIRLLQQRISSEMTNLLLEQEHCCQLF